MIGVYRTATEVPPDLCGVWCVAGNGSKVEPGLPWASLYGVAGRSTAEPVLARASYVELLRL